MADITAAIMITLDPAHEGGFQKNPNDRGNWTGGEIGSGTLVGTNGGITPADMPGVDIEHLTIDQKVAYYREHYVKPLYAEIVSQLILNKLFDMGVLFGIKEATEELQRAVLSANFPPPMLPVDGMFGPETLLLTNESDARMLLIHFQSNLELLADEIVAKRPVDAEFVNDWKRRIAS